MAIRKNTNPRMMDLQPEMQDILRRNGMQAHVVSDGTGYRLVVQGHDSPLLTYDLTERQMLALTDWGTNSANKKAYNVFTSIVGKDFYMPKNFVHTRNANGRVAMGLHGYRIGIGEYGRGIVHTNTIEGFWSQLKRSVDGTYHCISAKYLQLYLNEFVYRYNHRQLPSIFPVLIASAAQRVG